MKIRHGMDSVRFGMSKARTEVTVTPRYSGRPRRSEDVAEERITVRFTEKELANVERAAAKRGISISEFVRIAALAATLT